MKQKLIELFSGIIAGDGDIGSRMAQVMKGQNHLIPHRLIAMSRIFTKT